MRKTTDANKFCTRRGGVFFCAVLTVLLVLTVIPTTQSAVDDAASPVVQNPLEETTSAAAEGAGGDVPVFLMRGDSGEDVRCLQRQLQALGYDVGVCSGVYTLQTAAAVKAFQRDCGFAADGVCTASVRHAAAYLTRDAAASEWENSISEDALCRALETAGCCAPDDTQISGAEALRDALFLFQRTHGLAGSGVADYATLCALGMVSGAALSDGLTDSAAAEATVYDLRCRMLSEALAHFVLAYPAANDLYTLEVCAAMLLGRLADTRFPPSLDAVCTMFSSELPFVGAQDIGAYAGSLPILRAAERGLSAFADANGASAARGAVYVQPKQKPLPEGAVVCLSTLHFVFFR